MQDLPFLTTDCILLDRAKCSRLSRSFRILSLSSKALAIPPSLVSSTTLVSSLSRTEQGLGCKDLPTLTSFDLQQMQLVETCLFIHLSSNPKKAYPFSNISHSHFSPLTLLTKAFFTWSELFLKALWKLTFLASLTTKLAAMVLKLLPGKPSARVPRCSNFSTVSSCRKNKADGQGVNLAGFA